MTADLREVTAPAPVPSAIRSVDRPGRAAGLPVDPLAQAWEQILAAVLAEGPPEDPCDPPAPEPAEGPPEDLDGLSEAPDQLSDAVAVLRVAGAPVPAGDLDGPAVAAALAGDRPDRCRGRGLRMWWPR